MLFTSSNLIIVQIMVVLFMGCSTASVESKKFGSQHWMTNNLAATSFLNGDSILVTSTAEEWLNAYERRIPAIRRVKQTVNGLMTESIFFNWFAVIDPRGVCPARWSVPSDSDWSQLTEVEGKNTSQAFKSAEIWSDDIVSIKRNGFSAIPFGYINEEGQYTGGGLVANWWSKTERDDKSSWFRFLVNGKSDFGRYGASKKSGFTIRCVFSD